MDQLSTGRATAPPGPTGPEPAPGGPSAPDLLLHVLISEYEALKAEQNARIIARDHLMYATLAVFAATAAGVVGAGHAAGLVLLLPPVCIVLGWTYLANDEKVSAIGRYFRTALRPRLAAAIGAAPSDVLAWETAHRGGRLRVSGKYLQLAVDLIMFAVPAMLAPLSYLWSDSTGRPALTVVATAELLAATVLSTRIVLAADPRDGGEP
ncbi:hypothetical protein ABZX40_21170 [Streptomyces sp. NPDC004610]|uniref:hypothetical protein n=1 Tax=unclassified Streptomyces TaxID=2593676 RepID=UPI0033AFB9EC